MADKTKALALCGSIQGYRQFRVEWAVMCFLLNPNAKNKKKLKSVMATNVEDLFEVTNI